MIGVDKIEDIRRRARRGEPIAAIARAVGVSEPTARKYARMDDLSPEPPRRRKPESEVLAPYEGTIDSWLDDDCRNWRKQRHTAVRVYVGLRDELGYDGSYSTVQRYVRRRREEMARERDRRDAEGFLTLSWLPGEVQVDFGEADFRVRGVVTRGKYLTVTFPHPDVGPAQVFWGETSECVCQGLRNVFEFAGGVPRRAVFDNATEVGRRVGGEVRLSELFRRFAAHYGLDYTFTNPYSGNEKGNVENKVGCHRRNLFVPVPSFHDVAASDRRPLGDCLDPGAGKRHYRLGTPELELFGEDKDALSPLPPAAFSCVRWETRTCNKQGTFTVGGPHRYSAGPAYARRRVDVALGAFDPAAPRPGRWRRHLRLQAHIRAGQRRRGGRRGDRRVDRAQHHGGGEPGREGRQEEAPVQLLRGRDLGGAAQPLARRPGQASLPREQAERALDNRRDRVPHPRRQGVPVADRGLLRRHAAELVDFHLAGRRDGKLVAARRVRVAQ